MGERVPVAAGLFAETKDGARLIGSRCATCKTPYFPKVDYCRHPACARSQIEDAGVAWREIQAVAAASSRFSGGRGWGLNGNDVIDDMGPTGIPVYNLSAGCAAGGNAFNVGTMLVASGQHDVVLVVGGEKMPKG